MEAILLKPNASVGIYLGQSDANNYYDNTGHIFRTSGGAANLGKWNSTGLGIGTQSPSNGLELYGAARNIIVTNTTENAAGIIMQDAQDPGQNGRIVYDSGANKLYIQTHGGTGFTMDSSRNVGIGTTSPSKKLEVAGDVRIASGGDLILSDSGGGNDTFLYNDSQSLIGYINGAERFRVDSVGNVKVGSGNVSLSYASHGMEISGSGNQSLRLEADGSTAFEISARTGDVLLYNNGTARSIRFGVGGGEKFRINSDGNAYFFQTAIINTNNSALSGRDAGGTVRTMLRIDTGNSILLGDNGLSGQVHMYPSTYTQINTNHGYLQIGPQNTSHCHYTTDRSNHWFNTRVIINGGFLDSHNEDLTLRRASSNNDRITIEADQHSHYVNGTKRLEVKGNGTVQINGTLNATSDVVAYFSSDKRLKDNLKLIENPLDKVSKLSGYEFDWNDKQKTYQGHDIGVVAQEVEEVLPELVATREDGYKAVKYEKIVPLLIEAMKEQQQQINELKEKLNG